MLPQRGGGGIKEVQMAEVVFWGVDGRMVLGGDVDGLLACLEGDLLGLMEVLHRPIILR